MHHSLLPRVLASCIALAAATSTFAGERVLVSGDPALTQSLVDQYRDFLGWLLEIRFSPREQQQFDGYVIASWQRHDEAEMQSALEAVESAAGIARIDPEQRDLYRQEMLKTVLPSLRAGAQDDAEARWLLGLYEREHRALAQGQPPLTRAMATARADYIAFLMVNSGLLPIEPDQAFKQRMIEQLIAEYPRLSGERQQEIAQMPSTWAVLRATWAELGEADRNKYRNEWQQAAQDALSDWQRRAVRAMADSARLMRGLDTRTADAAQLAAAATEFERIVATLRQDAENREFADTLAATAHSLRTASQPQQPASADAGWLRNEMNDEQWAQYQQMSPQQQRDEQFRLTMQRARRQHSMSMWTGAHVMNNIYSMSGSSTRMTFNGFTP